MNLYDEFLCAAELAPPRKVAAAVASAVHAELNPPAWRVFLKFGLIQCVVGGVVLMFCPQFGVNLFPGMGLMALFMRFGEAGCMVGCGSVFLGASSIVGSVVLGREELLVIRRSRLRELAIMSLLAGGVLVCFGGGMVLTLSIAWAVGALASGFGFLELGWLVKTIPVARHRTL